MLGFTGAMEMDVSPTSKVADPRNGPLAALMTVVPCPTAVATPVCGSMVATLWVVELQATDMGLAVASLPVKKAGAAAVNVCVPDGIATLAGVIAMRTGPAWNAKAFLPASRTKRRNDRRLRRAENWRADDLLWCTNFTVRIWAQNGRLMR